MKKQLQKITLFSALLLSVGITAWGQVLNCNISASDSSICFGESSTLSISSANCGTLPASLQTGLNGWFPFCGNTNDLSFNSNNGTNNGATLTADVNNNNNSAYSFNGTNNTINLSNPFLGGVQVSQFTMNARVRFNSLANNPNIWGKTKFWGEVNFGVDNNGKVYLGWANSITGNKYSSIVSQNSVITANTWYDISIVFQSGSGQIYINGQPVVTSLTWSAQGGAILSTSTIENSCNFSQDANSSKFGVAISGGSPVRYLNGVLDEFKIWNYALSAGQIQQNYQTSVLSTTWTSGQINQNSILVQPSQTTTYSVTVTDGISSCTDSISIQVNQPLSLFQGSDTLTICGLNTTLDATNSAAGAYSWNTGDTTSSIIVSNSGEYNVTVTDTAGCSASDTVFVSVIDPTITAGQTAFCLGDSTTMSINNVSNSCVGLTGTLQNGLVGWWPFCGNANDESGNGNNGTVNGAILTQDRFGNSNKAYSFDGLNDNIIANRTILNQFSVSIWYNTSQSSAITPLIDAYNSNWEIYLKNLNPTFTKWITSPSNYQESTSTIVSPISEWNNLICLYNPNSTNLYLNGILISTFPNVTLSNNSNGSFYFGASISGIAQFFNGKLDDIGIWNRILSPQEIDQLYNQGALLATWSDGTINQSSIQVQPTQTSTYSVTVTDGVGSCTDSITIQINNPQINAGADISICEGDSTTLTGTGASTYAWDNGIVNGQAFVPTVEGLYSVVGTDTLGCSNSDTLFLDLLQPTSSSISPVNCVTFTAPDGAIYTNSGQYTAIIPNNEGCDSTISINLTINNTSTGTDTKVACDSYTWIDGNTYTSTNNSATYLLQNANGCDSTVTLNLTINKLNGLNAGNNINACEGENISLSATGATSYNWTGGVSNGVPFVPPVGTTIYTVTGTDDNGCTATDALTVLVEYCLDIPGGISPNGDNSNDTWTIIGLNQYPDAKVLIFDRWGQKVFSGDATNPTWNGTYEGKELPTADYYYIIELGNGEKFNGVVTLKK